MLALRLIFCIGGIFYLTGCLSYDDLRDMKEINTLENAQKSFHELTEHLQAPCEDPTLYAHIMQTGHHLSNKFDLAIHSKTTHNEFYQILLRNIKAIDLTKVKKWETNDLKSDINYLKCFSLQLYIDQHNTTLLESHLHKAFALKSRLSLPQLILLAKTIEKHKSILKSDRRFCHEYLRFFIETHHKIPTKLTGLINTQMSYFLDKDSGEIVDSFSRAHYERPAFRTCYLEYALKNTLLFNSTFKRETFIHYLCQLHLENSYEQKLRDNLYLKYLSLTYMAITLQKYPTSANLKLNYWYWKRLTTLKEIKDKHALKKNYQSILKLATSSNQKLAYQAEQILLNYSPISYAISLCRLNFSEARFQKVLGLIKHVNDHYKYISSTEKIFYSNETATFITPHTLFGTDLQTKHELMSYMKEKSEYYCRQGFKDSNIKTFTKILLLQKALGFKVFEESFSQKKLCQLLFSSRQAEIYNQLLPHMWSIAPKQTFRILLQHTQRPLTKRHEFLHLKQLYSKLSFQDKLQVRNEMRNALNMRIQSDNDDLSLSSVKDCYELGFHKELSNTIIKRWPGYKTN